MSQLLEKILEDSNIQSAEKRVVANGGAFGVDGMKTEELDSYLKEHLGEIKEQIRTRRYEPQPVRRVEIPKPNGGVRKLGIPTAVDRVIQQAVAQVLSPIFEPLFSDRSYGFRPGRRCQDAIVKALEYFNDGYTWVVDIDLEKFFDNVPQDRLMSLVGRVIRDGDTESLIRKFLKAGVMVGESYEPTEKGTPQGGNLSPLLSNVMLSELDRELEARGLRFTRYADDCIIAVKSHAAANRVMHSITKFIEHKLGLKVNATKTKIVPPNNLTYLGFGFVKRKDGWHARPSDTAKEKFVRNLKKLCERRISIDLKARIGKINAVVRGWVNYFRMGMMKSFLAEISGRLCTKIRVIIWKQWKTIAKRRWALKRLGLTEYQAWKLAGFHNHYMAVAKTSWLKYAISRERLARKGLVLPDDYYEKGSEGMRVRTAQCRTAC